MDTVDWISFDRWEECRQMERPGYAFEVINADGQRIETTCTIPLPMPMGWTTPPQKFRLIVMTPPRRSDPIPPATPR
jgi:hypothetical protein